MADSAAPALAVLTLSRRSGQNTFPLTSREDLRLKERPRQVGQCEERELLLVSDASLHTLTRLVFSAVTIVTVLLARVREQTPYLLGIFSRRWKMPLAKRGGMHPLPEPRVSRGAVSDTFFRRPQRRARSSCGRIQHRSCRKHGGWKDAALPDLRQKADCIVLTSKPRKHEECHRKPGD